VLSLALMGVILMRVWSPDGAASGKAERAKQTAVASSLPHWSVTAPARIHVSLDSALSPAERDWFAAIGRAGSTVTWDAPGIPAIAVALTRMADPAGISELSASVPAGSVVMVRDHVGLIDSVTAGKDGIRLAIPGDAASLGVSVARSTAWTAPADSVVFKRILIEGSANWETKFTIAALTERGWKVDALTHVAPGVDVREGNPASPDTSIYAAIIAVDSTASLVARGAGAFVHSGGGLVTMHDASSIGPSGSTPVILERRAGEDVRAYRSGNGRVIRVGYKDLWRQRLADDDTVSDPVAAHRAWLARAVASVAYAPRVALHATLPSDSSADPAPLADMVDRMGARSSAADDTAPFRSEVPSSVLFGILLTSLLLELTSRRLRGAR
jgi:hypothetical protein